jgi:hypothetical protein
MHTRSPSRRSLSEDQINAAATALDATATREDGMCVGGSNRRRARERAAAPASRSWKTLSAWADRLPENREVAMTQSARRRDMLLAALVSSIPIGFAETAAASPLNSSQTIIRPPGQLQWKSNPAFPEPSVDSCPLTGDTNQPGLYYTLVRWWPGFMSAPHSYTTNRFCVVVSGMPQKWKRKPAGLPIHQERQRIVHNGPHELERRSTP